MNIIYAIFITSAFLLIYHYIGYALLLTILSFFCKKTRIREEITPSVTILISAYNESKVIRSKIENVLSLDYPSDKLEVIIASAGSTDDTANIVSEFQDQRIIFNPHSQRMGKLTNLNRSVPGAKSEIIVFSDANSIFAPDAIKKLVRNFKDKKVGCVCGVKKIKNHDHLDSIGKSESIYWRVESFLKKKESEVNSVIGADGSIYAIRKHLYSFPKEADLMVTDDFVISMKIIEKGFEVVFEPEALVFESASLNMEDEFERKARILAGTLSALLQLKKLFLPRYSLTLFQLVSHKILRWLSPFLLISALLNSLLWGLADTLVLLVVFWFQCIFYLLALTGYFLEKTKLRIKRFPVFYIPFYFCLTNIAQIAGLYRFITRRQKATWEMASR